MLHNTSYILYITRLSNRGTRRIGIIEDDYYIEYVTIIHYTRCSTHTRYHTRKSVDFRKTKKQNIIYNLHSPPRPTTVEKSTYVYNIYIVYYVERSSSSPTTYTHYSIIIIIYFFQFVSYVIVYLYKKKIGI